MGADVEARLTELRRDGQLAAVASETFAAYGNELYGFLKNVLGDAAAASEVFSQAIEDVWRGLPGFHGRCSMRTWIYVIAQNAVGRYRRSPWNRVRTTDSHLEDLVERVRSQTSPWQRTEVKDKWRALRETLDPDDRALLVLRIDRELDWIEISRVMLASSDEPAKEALTRESARLRKRFQTLKSELRQRAKAAGLFEGS